MLISNLKCYSLPHFFPLWNKHIYCSSQIKREKPHPLTSQSKKLSDRHTIAVSSRDSNAGTALTSPQAPFNILQVQKKFLSPLTTNSLRYLILISKPSYLLTSSVCLKLTSKHSDTEAIRHPLRDFQQAAPPGRAPASPGRLPARQGHHLGKSAPSEPHRREAARPPPCRT